MEFRTSEARERYDAVVAAAPGTVVGCDFDGTLSPIVADPGSAVIHPDGPQVLTELAAVVGAVAVVTGRPVAQVLELGQLDRVADRLPDDVRLLVRGQYGNELWESSTRETTTPPAPESLDRFRKQLPDLLAEHGAADAFVEEKGLAVAVHTRRMGDPQAAFDRLTLPLRTAAEELGLALEPGRLVLEVRAPGGDKGDAVRVLAEEYAAEGFVFLGDDLGDVPAFDAVRELREQGLAGLLVCSGSTEQTALVERSDLVVDGPDGVVAFLRRLTRDVRGH